MRLQPSQVVLRIGSDLTLLAVQTALQQSSLNASLKMMCEPLAEDASQYASVIILDDYEFDRQSIHISARPAYVLLSNQLDPHHVHRVMTLGFRGYLYLGDSLVERLPQAVRDVAAGGIYLSPSAAAPLIQMDHYVHHIQPRITPYQVEVLRLMSQHWSGGRIAAQLGRSTTAIYQVQRFLRDLFEVETNGELLDSAVQLGILPDTRRIFA
jgi:DNA-binding CsgD family transcriptional regulator